MSLSVSRSTTKELASNLAVLKANSNESLGSTSDSSRCGEGMQHHLSLKSWRRKRLFRFMKQSSGIPVGRIFFQLALIIFASTLLSCAELKTLTDGLGSLVEEADSTSR